MNRKLLYLTFASIALLGLLHQVGSIFFLYWSLWWFDIFMHFLGGLSVGLLFIWATFVSGVFGQRVPTKWGLMISVVVFTMFVGVGWEVFEHVYDIANPAHQSYQSDTFQDLIADLLGAVCAGIIGRLRKFYA